MDMDCGSQRALIWISAPGLYIENDLFQSALDPPGKSGVFYLYWHHFKQQNLW